MIKNPEKEDHQLSRRWSRDTERSSQGIKIQKNLN